MKIKLIVLDADGTMWDHLNISAMKLPFRLEGSDTIVSFDGSRLTLNEGIREFLEFARSRGIRISLASWNQPEPVFEALRLLSIADYFVHPKAEPHPDKADMLVRILKELEEEGVVVKPQEVLYVDDRDRHLDGIRTRVGDVVFLRYGVDFKSWRELMEVFDARFGCANEPSN